MASLPDTITIELSKTDRELLLRLLEAIENAPRYRINISPPSAPATPPNYSPGYPAPYVTC